MQENCGLYTLNVNFSAKVSSQRVKCMAHDRGLASEMRHDAQ